MSEQKKTNETANEPRTIEEITEEMCQGLWRLKPDVVLRVEEDGAILFDPDTGGVGTVNVTGSALLQWKRDRICYNEWCEALSKHYKKIDFTQIKADVKKFFADISRFWEIYDEKND